MISIIAPAIAKTCEKHGKNKAETVYTTNDHHG
jgi:hypothetical protein